MGKTMKVLVCGGREFHNLKYGYYVLDFVHTKLHPITTVIQGGAFGADALADHWAFDRKLNRIEYPADWDKYGKAAGMIRNAEMLKENPDLVIAFPGGRGTAGMVKLAKNKNINVMEIDMNELVQRVRLEQLEARKNKDTLKASLLTTLIGEYESQMKSSVENHSEEGTMTATIKKFVKNIEQTLAVREVADLIKEKEILLSFLPQQLTEGQLELIIQSYINEGDDSVPLVMKRLKAEYNGMFDGKLASEVTKRML